MLAFEELRKELEARVIATVVVAFTDMQGRLMGERLHAEFFVEEMDAGMGWRGATTSSHSTMEMDPGAWL